jgi:urease accessory protein
MTPCHDALQLMWLASPALPIGAFSYSEGLEAAIDHGYVSDAASATRWLLDQLHLSQSRGDMALIAQAMPAWRAMDIERLQALSRWVLATRESAEMRLQTEQMGRSLWDWLRNLERLTPSQEACAQAMPSTYPVVMALALSQTGVDCRTALHSYAFGWAENMTQAALKAVPLGQNAGQRMLGRLVQDIPLAVDRALATTDEYRQNFSPMLAILSAQHETQYSRLFRS